jgi:hypothetical protein
MKKAIIFEVLSIAKVETQGPSNTEGAQWTDLLCECLERLKKLHSTIQIQLIQHNDYNNFIKTGSTEQTIHITKSSQPYSISI